MGLEAKYLDDREAGSMEIDPGWWAFDEAGPMLGPYPSKRTLLLFAAIEAAIVRSSDLEHEMMVEVRAPSGRPRRRPKGLMGKQGDQDPKSAGRAERQRAIGAELRKTLSEVTQEETPALLKELAERLDRELAEKARRQDGEP